MCLTPFRLTSYILVIFFPQETSSFPTHLPISRLVFTQAQSRVQVYSAVGDGLIKKEEGLGKGEMGKTR